MMRPGFEVPDRRNRPAGVVRPLLTTETPVLRWSTWTWRVPGVGAAGAGHGPIVHARMVDGSVHASGGRSIIRAGIIGSSFFFALRLLGAAVHGVEMLL
jgi:hypothetical protein